MSLKILSVIKIIIINKLLNLNYKKMQSKL